MINKIMILIFLFIIMSNLEADIGEKKKIIYYIDNLEIMCDYLYKKCKL